MTLCVVETRLLWRFVLYRVEQLRKLFQRKRSFESLASLTQLSNWPASEQEVCGDTTSRPYIFENGFLVLYKCINKNIAWQ